MNKPTQVKALLILRGANKIKRAFTPTLATERKIASG